MARNLSGKRIPKAKWGATRNQTVYRVDVNPNVWMHFSTEKGARDMQQKMGGKVFKWNDETQKFEKLD